MRNTVKYKGTHTHTQKERTRHSRIRLLCEIGLVYFLFARRFYCFVFLARYSHLILLVFLARALAFFSIHCPFILAFFIFLLLTYLFYQILALSQSTPAVISLLFTCTQRSWRSKPFFFSIVFFLPFFFLPL